MPGNRFKGLVTNLLSDAVWDSTKRILGGSLFMGTLAAIWERVRHQSVDWWGIGGLFLLTCFVLLWPRRRRDVPSIPQAAPLTSQSPPDNSLKEQIETLHDQIKRTEIQHNSELWNSREFYRQCTQCTEEKKELAAKVEAFTPLQLEALSLSLRLLDFIKVQGPPPRPKYTLDEISGMPLEQSTRLVRSNDRDYAFACEFYFGDHAAIDSGDAHTAVQYQKKMEARTRLLDPWYERLRARYDEQFRGEVEKIHNRFACEGVSDETLRKPVSGLINGRDVIKEIAAKLWEMAYRVREKEVVIENP